MGHQVIWENLKRAGKTHTVGSFPELFFFLEVGEPQALLAESSPQEPGLLGFPEF